VSPRAQREDAAAAAAGARSPAFARGWALFLDVDGTLLELAEHPRAVRVQAGLVAALGRLQRLMDGAVALVSGRPVADLDRLFAPLRLAAAGQHGAERRGAGGESVLERPGAGALAAARAALAALAARHPELLVEDKGAALAVHYRRAPHLEPAVERALGAIAGASGGDYALQPGKMVRELVPHGRNKGGAIAAFLREPPFAGRTAVFIGDDLSDEHGFAFVNAIGGHSVKVGAGASAARWRFAGAAEVRAWLGAYADWLERPV
jgi:trehalose 6-phosphate phosphatase